MSQRLNQLLPQSLLQKTCNGSIPTFKSYIICDNTQEYKLDSQNSSTNNSEDQVKNLRRPTIIKSKTGQLKRKKAPPRPPPPKTGSTSRSTNISVKPATSEKNDYLSELEAIFAPKKEINTNLDRSSFLKQNDTVVTSNVPKPAFRYSKKGHTPHHCPRNIDVGITSSTSSSSPDYHLVSVSASCRSTSLVDVSALSCLNSKPKTYNVYNQEEKKSQENLLDLNNTYSINEYLLLEGASAKLQVPFQSGNVLPEKHLLTPGSSTCLSKDTNGSCTSPYAANNKNDESYLNHSSVAQLEKYFPVSNIPKKVPNESKISSSYVSSYQGVWPPVPISFEDSSSMCQSSIDTKAKEKRSSVKTVCSTRTSTKEEKAFHHTSSLSIPQNLPPTFHNVPDGNMPGNTGNLDRLRKCKTLYSFKGESPDELTFKEGDVILFEEKINEEWWMGYLGDQQGIFPSSYVVMEGTDDFMSTDVNSTEGSTTCTVVALYDYKREDERDLTFKVKR
ncbi:uncharacterized protein LOC106458986 isoform X2 [Limulus polyphemus]|uniref:Uncharacterized protein LOC106458986 isoform X2 n=1 Tax=Limulus polyphemus TaxID=6850 RepID=A0ABM1SBR5_LIMPO|nr:uncharacterized protein LOC106458986 isoform X2 [Limulus polyphemus]